MTVPAQPKNLLKRPFADSGNYQIIPDKQTTHGRASLELGFPVETQQPFSAGGVAPNRMDFNGMFHILSAAMFWQQSGGMWSYSAELNYSEPAMIYHRDALWWCMEDNGPDTVGGVKEPGAGDSKDFWCLFVKVSAGSGGGALFGGNPVGTVIMYYGITAPEGYLICNGSPFSVTTYPQLYALLGKATTPDMRGLFVRGYDPAGINDANGAGRALGSYQGDAIRNIWAGYFWNDWHSTHAEGALRNLGGRNVAGSARTDFDNNRVDFDASRVVPTAAENRPKNINLLYCIKHD